MGTSASFMLIERAIARALQEPSLAGALRHFLSCTVDSTRIKITRGVHRDAALAYVPYSLISLVAEGASGIPTTATRRDRRDGVVSGLRALLSGMSAGVQRESELVLAAVRSSASSVAHDEKMKAETSAVMMQEAAALPAGSPQQQEHGFAARPY